MKNFFLLSLLSIIVFSNSIILDKTNKNNIITVNWYLKEPKRVTNIKITANNKKIQLIKNIIAPNDKFKTSIIFLVDNSKSMRPALRGIKRTIRRIIKSLNLKRHKFLISTFDKELLILKDFNDPLQNYKKALNKIDAKGNRTELYRLSIEAIKLFDKVNTNRKILILISDGDFEDTTYTAKDLISIANINRVQILALGYKDSIKLQGILRPSLETNGKLWIANKNNFLMKKGFIKELLPYFDNGGVVSFENNFYNTNGKKKLKLSLTGDDLNISEDFSIKTKISKENYEKNSSVSSNSTIGTIKSQKKIAKIEKNSSSSNSTKEKSNKYNSFLDKYLIAIIVGALSIISMFGYLIFSKKKKKKINENFYQDSPKEDSPKEDSPKEDKGELELHTNKTIAYLEDDNGKIYRVFKEKSSIGREISNDIVIEDSYISNYHANLLLKNNNFYIIDSSSLNGIGINSIPSKSNRIRKAKIKDGDIIYFGPKKFLFKVP